MPWQNEEVVGFHRMCFLLGNDRNICAGSEAAEFVLVYFGDCWEQVGRDSAMLQEDVSLGGSSVAKHGARFCLQGMQQTKEFLFVAYYRSLKCLMLRDGA